MPGYDGTGPAGAGNVTGLGRGPCGNEGNTDAMDSNGRGMGFRQGMSMRCGMGFGRGRANKMRRGNGRGYGPGFAALDLKGKEPNEPDFKTVLTKQKDYLQSRLDAIDKRLEAL